MTIRQTHKYDWISHVIVTITTCYSFILFFSLLLPPVFPFTLHYCYCSSMGLTTHLFLYRYLQCHPQILRLSSEEDR